MGKRQNSVLTSRRYVHGACGEITEIDGPEFQAFANPLSEMDQTYCSHCEDHFGIAEFRWEDTDESIADYFVRHRSGIPADVLERTSHSQVVKYAIRGAIVGAVIAVAIGILIGLASSVLVGVISAVVLAVLAGPLGAIINFMGFEKKIVQALMEEHLGVEDVGELR